MYTNLPTSQDYIFRILQHFATKLYSFSNSDNFFPEIFFVIPRKKVPFQTSANSPPTNSAIRSHCFYVNPCKRPYEIWSVENRLLKTSGVYQLPFYFAIAFFAFASIMNTFQKILISSIFFCLWINHLLSLLQTEGVANLIPGGNCPRLHR